jgi:polygalacturonase
MTTAEALAPCRSLLLRLALASLLPLAASAEPAAALRPSAIFNVKSFGATGDGSRLETTALQRAIDACHENAGGTVLVPAGSYITGTLKLRSHVTLRLESGAVLLGSQDLADYANDIQGAVEAPVFSKCLLYAEGATNVAFEGAGRIDGRGSRAAFPEKVDGRLADRPMLMRLVGCKGVAFSGLTFRNSASWMLHLVECRQVRFDGIAIESRGNHINNDGIDLDGCRDVTIENCRIDSGDDAICPKSTSDKPCENIVVRNCDLSSHTAGFKLGTSSRAGFLNITVTDTRFRDCPMGAIKLLMVDGGRMENIELSRLTMENVGGPIFIRLGNRGRRYDRPTEQVYGTTVSPEGMPVGVVRGVVIRQLKAEVNGEDLDRQGIMITGIPGHRIENVTLDDIQIRFAGKPRNEPVTREVPEDIARYPEQFFFGLLPSWGLFVRHVEGLTLNNVRLDRAQPDVRWPFVLQDVRALRAKGFFVNGAAAENEGGLKSND